MKQKFLILQCISPFKINGIIAKWLKLIFCNIPHDLWFSLKNYGFKITGTSYCQCLLMTQNIQRKDAVRMRRLGETELFFFVVAPNQIPIFDFCFHNAF